MNNGGPLTTFLSIAYIYMEGPLVPQKFAVITQKFGSQ